MARREGSAPSVICPAATNGIEARATPAPPDSGPKVGRPFRDRNHRHPCTPDSRQPGQPHGRGRCAARRRQLRPCGGAVGRVDRCARGGRKARRRQVGLSRQGCARGDRGREWRDRPGDHRARRRGSGRDRLCDDRAGWHREQGPAGRERDSGREPGGGQGGGGCAWPAALSLCRRCVGACSSRSDDEHHQWWRACRQCDRFSGVHDRAGRRGLAGRGGALRRGDFPHAEERPARQGPVDRSG